MEEKHLLETEARRMLVGKEWKGVNKFYRGKNKQKVFWTPLQDNRDVIDIGEIDFNQTLTPSEAQPDWNAQATAYLYRSIYLEREVKIRIHCGSDDGLRMWLNGLPFLTHNGERGLSTTSHEALLVLKPGFNHLLVKVGNAGGDWKFRIQPYQRVSQDLINKEIGRAHV